MTVGLGDFPWDFDDGKIATNDGDGTFGSAVDIKACQLVAMTDQSRSGVLEGDGGKRALASKTIGVTGRIRFGGIQQDVLAIVLGASQYTYGTTPNQMKRLPRKNKMRPYFSLSSRALASEGNGDVHFFLPKIKLMGDIEFAMEEGNFIIIEADFEGVFDDYVLDNGEVICYDLIEHETAVAVAIPPTNAGYTTS